MEQPTVSAQRTSSMVPTKTANGFRSWSIKKSLSKNLTNKAPSFYLTILKEHLIRKTGTNV